ncbi:uncharacterized protein BCR38DRAFT_334233 [Pseudomassariella vexata]|uniref:Erythromycin esterase n=1 Tax=Pseudomassariella vexata TaxID=1141098 RepID=A0A1Y2EG30_9PEZI|nr:uncharacterized protein BCR38DRAFT_334233 [Pseudomassariella vexata]ORY69755.1 hypothetical protein BCR38DRAFT_334233 [Pseudomassariella vexata]
MSPPRRRSARLASGTSSKERPASVQPQLSALTEGDESCSEQPTKSLDAIMSSPTTQPTTPAAVSPVKLPKSEMHPSKFHPGTAAPSSGLKLGFADINRDQNARDHTFGAIHETPSKAPTPFTFRVSRPSAADKGLTPEAQKMMNDLREEAAKIKAELAAKRSEETLDEVLERRRIAKAKGKAGRFSDVHMAEFKKMDSIANHPSVYRAAPGRPTPLKAGTKRSQSKANLNDAESVLKKAASARAPPKSLEKQHDEPESPTKRVRQRLDDDASTLRPVSRDGSSIPAPRPKSSGNDSIRSAIPRSRTVASIMTPTKASTARTQVTKTPTIPLVKSPSKPDLESLARSPSKPDLSSLARTPSKVTFGSLKKSATLNNLNAEKTFPTIVQTPGRFARVKSILKRQFSASKPKSSIPQVASSIPKTPGNAEKKKAAAPVTTPGQRFGFDKHVEFTPDSKAAALTQNSPSPVKSAIPRSKTMAKLPAPHYPSLGSVLSAKKTREEVSYPDLSAFGAEAATATSLTPSVPGTFTFRSDHTIRFGSTSPNGFGSSSGQASLRHVRQSTVPANHMPGSFPAARESIPDKENTDPALMSGIPHGMSNKKRHRAIWDHEEDDEGARRGAKKLRKNPSFAEGARLINSSPIKTLAAGSRTPSPQKKKGLTLSRLNMLALPKVRK